LYLDTRQELYLGSANFCQLYPIAALAAFYPPCPLLCCCSHLKTEKLTTGHIEYTKVEDLMLILKTEYTIVTSYNKKNFFKTNNMAQIPFVTFLI
jgi:hypothetical protein